MIKIRDARKSDIPELKKLFINTILNINIKDYTQDEVADWSLCGLSVEHWKDLFDKFKFWVAEENFVILGFVSIDENGYLHSLFVHKNHQRRGVAKLLLETAEKYAEECGVRTITSDVSITALPFFMKKGYSVTEEKYAKATLLLLKNYKVEKSL